MSEDAITPAAEYSISEVSALTAVNPVTLRAWQRRYGLLKPRRDSKGHRLYSAEDLDTIRAIQGWLERGVPIREVKSLLAGHQREEDAATSRLPETRAVLDGLASLDRDRVEQLLGNCLREYPLPTFRQRLFEPVEQALNSGQRAHRSLQSRLWQSLLITLLSTVMDDNGHRHKRRAWLLHCGQRGRSRAWLEAYALCMEGYRVTLLEELAAPLNPLAKLLTPQRVDRIVVVGEEKLPAAIINELLLLPCAPELRGSIADIHGPQLSGPERGQAVCN